jgi:hypothetical protein
MFFEIIPPENFPSYLLETLTDLAGKLSTEAILIVFEELRKKGNRAALIEGRILIIILTKLIELDIVCREPGMVRQEQDAVSSHVEEARRMGETDLPVGE